MPTRVLLVGTGAIGGFYASRLATVQNVLVSALCRSNYNAVKAHGIKVSSPKFGNYVFKPEFVFPNPEEARRVRRENNLNWDYLLVATKVLPDLSDDSQLLEDLVGENTSIVLVQNGLGIEQPYRKRFPRTTILSATTIASAVQSSPGIIEHNRWTKFSVGPFLPHLDSGSGLEDGDELASSRRDKLVDLLKSAGITDAEGYSHADMQFIRWHKTAINASMNPSAVLSGGAGNREVSQDPELTIHAKAIMEEVLSAAPKVLGKEMPWKELNLATPEQVMNSVSKNMTGSRPSMWWDWVEGRKMELEAILGNPMRMAREKGIDMPRVQSLYALVRKAQEKRDASVKGGKM